MEQQEQIIQPINKLSNKEIIKQISLILGPGWKFEMDDFYGDRGGIPYPEIESLDILHWKKVSTIGQHITNNKNEEEQIVKKIQELNLGEVEICRYKYYWKYLDLKLKKYNNRLITQYNNYLDYYNSNVEKINKIYMELDEKVPEQFIGYILFSGKNY